MSAAKILIVEDDADVVLFLKDELECLDYQVLIARNGREGLEQAQREKPDLIVLDVMLPEMDGYAVCEQLKTSPETKRIPVLMLTAKGQKDDELTGLRKGADDFLSKPYDWDVLEARVRALLRRSDYHRSAPKATKKQRLEGVRQLLARCGDPSLSAYEKGLALEDLAAALFAPCFDVYNRVRTETGEVDLWLERTTALPFWTDYGAIAIVECKNRSQRLPVTSADVSVLIDKCTNPVAKLGFFVSLGPFTKDALAKIRDQNVRRRADSPLIVPLRHRDIDELVQSECDIEEWLRGLVRRARQDDRRFYNYGYKRQRKTEAASS